MLTGGQWLSMANRCCLIVVILTWVIKQERGQSINEEITKGPVIHEAILGLGE